jgi:hypothetical protein
MQFLQPLLHNIYSDVLSRSFHDEVRLILHTECQPQIKAFLSTVYSCGPRRSEALNLEVATSIRTQNESKVYRNGWSLSI